MKIFGSIGKKVSSKTIQGLFQIHIHSLEDFYVCPSSLPAPSTPSLSLLSARSTSSTKAQKKDTSFADSLIDLLQYKYSIVWRAGKKKGVTEIKNIRSTFCDDFEDYNFIEQNSSASQKRRSMKRRSVQIRHSRKLVYVVDFDFNVDFVTDMKVDTSEGVLPKVKDKIIYFDVREHSQQDIKTVGTITANLTDFTTPPNAMGSLKRTCIFPVRLYGSTSEKKAKLRVTISSIWLNQNPQKTPRTSVAVEEKDKKLTNYFIIEEDEQILLTPSSSRKGIMTPRLAALNQKQNVQVQPISGSDPRKSMASISSLQTRNEFKHSRSSTFTGGSPTTKQTPSSFLSNDTASPQSLTQAKVSALIPKLNTKHLQNGMEEKNTISHQTNDIIQNSKMLQNDDVVDDDSKLSISKETDNSEITDRSQSDISSNPNSNFEEATDSLTLKNRDTADSNHQKSSTENIKLNVVNNNEIYFDKDNQAMESNLQLSPSPTTPQIPSLLLGGVPTAQNSSSLFVSQQQEKMTPRTEARAMFTTEASHFVSQLRKLKGEIAKLEQEKRSMQQRLKVQDPSLESSTPASQQKLISDLFNRIEQYQGSFKTLKEHVDIVNERVQQVMSKLECIENEKAGYPKFVSSLASEGQKKVAVVYCDLSDCGRLWELSKEKMIEVLDIYDDVIRECLKLCYGYEMDISGGGSTDSDGIICCFPSAKIAIKFSLLVQLKLMDADWPKELLELKGMTLSLGKKNESDNEENLYRGLRCRMGVDTGEMDKDIGCHYDTEHKRYVYFGETIKKATIITSYAQGGQILASDNVFYDMKSKGENEDLAAMIPSIKSIVQYLGEQELEGIEKKESLYLFIPEKLRGREFRSFNQLVMKQSMIVNKLYKDIETIRSAGLDSFQVKLNELEEHLLTINMLSQLYNDHINEESDTIQKESQSSKGNDGNINGQKEKNHQLTANGEKEHQSRGSYLLIQEKQKKLMEELQTQKEKSEKLEHKLLNFERELQQLSMMITDLECSSNPPSSREQVPPEQKQPTISAENIQEVEEDGDEDSIDGENQDSEGTRTNEGQSEKSQRVAPTNKLFELRLEQEIALAEKKFRKQLEEREEEIRHLIHEKQNLERQNQDLQKELLLYKPESPSNRPETFVISEGSSSGSSILDLLKEQNEKLQRKLQSYKK